MYAGLPARSGVHSGVWARPEDRLHSGKESPSSTGVGCGCSRAWTMMWAVPERMCAGLLHSFSPFPGPFCILLSHALAGPANGIPWAPLLSDLLAGLNNRRQEHGKERKLGCFCPASFLLWHCFLSNLCSPPPPPWFQLSLFSSLQSSGGG